MFKFEAKAKKIIELLGLTWAPIAGKFSADPEGVGDSTRKLRICEAFDLVRRENLVLNLSKANCTCRSGRHFTGLELLPLGTIASTLTEYKVYESVNTAMDSIRRQPQPVNRGDFFILGPLEKFETDPDVVFLFVNPAQADRILGLISFRGAEPFTYYPACTLCSTITNALAKRRPEINLISVFERRRGKWSPDELILAMPLNDFKTAVENIPNSAFGTA